MTKRSRASKRTHGPWGLVLLLWLTGCAAQPGLLGAPWQVARSLPGGHLAMAADSGQRAVEVELEMLTPQRAEQLRLSGTQVPRVSERTADPRVHQDFIDRRVTAVGFGLTEGGYLLYCEGLALPVLVPESHVDLGLTSAQALNASLYPDRNSALADLAADGSASKPSTYAYYRGAGGALIVPTIFSPATTPRIARTMFAVREQLAQTVQRELKVLLVTLTGTRVLQGIFSRVIQVGLEEPSLRPPLEEEGFGRQAPGPPQRPPPQPRPAGSPSGSSPSPAGPSSGPPAPEPVTPAPAPPTPAPSPLAPSPGLVQALTGNNPARPVAAGPRLPQDVAVKPKVPRLLERDRPIGPSPSQNAQLQADLDYLDNIGAKNIRVNQQQITARNRQRVGINRPDLQFDYEGRRYHVEYDTPMSGRGPNHQARIMSNDPDADTILLTVP